MANRGNVCFPGLAKYPHLSQGLVYAKIASRDFLRFSGLALSGRKRTRTLTPSLFGGCNLPEVRDEPVNTTEVFFLVVRGSDFMVCTTAFGCFLLSLISFRFR